MQRAAFSFLAVLPAKQPVTATQSARIAKRYSGKNCPSPTFERGYETPSHCTGPTLTLNDPPRAGCAHPVIYTQGGSIAMKKALLATLCVLAAGCSTRGQVNPDVMQIATTPLTCSNASECSVWWQRAQSWVGSHSAYKIEASTDSLIQTAGPAWRQTRAGLPDHQDVEQRRHRHDRLRRTLRQFAGLQAESVGSGRRFQGIRAQWNGRHRAAARHAAWPHRASQPLESAPAQSVGTPGDVPVSQ